MTKKIILAFLMLSSVSFLQPGIDSKSDNKQPPSVTKQEKTPFALKPGQKVFIGIIPLEAGPPTEASSVKEIEIQIDQLSGEQEAQMVINQEEREKLIKRLEELEKERNILTGDFYGLNQYGYRYALVFDRLGYIRYRLDKVNKEIAEITKKLRSGF
jgi:tetrahydromethanopterin S-methyltransferase subunit G